MPVTYEDLVLIQQNDSVVKPDEVVAELVAAGRKVSRRTWSFWQAQGLVPPVERVGARGGVYPRSVLPLAVFIADGRVRGWSVETIRALLPLWRHLAMATSNQHVSLAQFERLARSLDLDVEVNYHVPSVVEHSMAMLCADCRSGISWELKDGRVIPGRNGFQMGFVLTAVSPADGVGDVIDSTQLTIPGLHDFVDPHDPATVVLGTTNGTEIRGCGHGHNRSTAQRSARRTCPQTMRRRSCQEGALQLPLA